MPELIEEQITKLKSLIIDEVAAMKGAIMADLKGGDPDPEYQKKLEERIGEMQDSIKELMKPLSKGREISDDAFDTLYGKGAEGWGQFAIDVKEWGYGRQEDRLKQYKAAAETLRKEAKAAGAGMQENVDSEGGFVVPTEQSNELLTMGEALSQLLPRVRRLPMSSNTLKLNYIQDTDRSSGALFGGVQMYWVAEEGTTAATKPKLGQVTLSLNKLFGLAYATSELIEDSPISIGPWLSQEFAEAFGWQMDYEILNGSGAGRPQGIVNTNSLISVAKEPEQQAATIVAQNIIKMYARMPSRNRQNAIWVANEDTLPQLMTMSIAAGTAAIPVWIPGNSIANKPYDMLMGKELVYTEHCQTLGTVGDIFFWDPASYLMGMKSTGVRSDVSIHLKFETDETAFRFIYRVDGRCPWPSEQTPRHSSDTLSPNIAIAVRE